jgi:hypothetical protein
MSFAFIECMNLLSENPKSVEWEKVTPLIQKIVDVPLKNGLSLMRGVSGFLYVLLVIEKKVNKIQNYVRKDKLTVKDE